MRDSLSFFSLRRLTWTLAYVMASTGCGGGCGCGPACSLGPDYDCEPAWEFPPDAQIPDSSVPDGTPGDGDSDGMAEPSACPGIGEPCTERLGCPTPESRCFEPATFGGGSFGLGRPGDPILGHPDGDDTFVPTPLFPGGYCTTSYPQDGVTDAQCNLRGEAEVDPVCGACGTCVDLFGLDTEEELSDFVPGFCALRCTPRMDSNDCRPGYECSLELEACVMGCQSDDECRIAREDTNGVPGIQTPTECDAAPDECRPADCDTAPSNPDACRNPRLNYDSLVYDTESGAVCDPVTSRCIGPHDPVAVAGDACTEDAGCERWGRCILEEDDRWLGGSCTKDRCDLEGNECTEGGVCTTAPLDGFEEPACFAACTVGGYDADDPESWVTPGVARAECRDGYGCQWTGRGAGGDWANGACLPVRYSPDVAEPGIGQGCAIDDDCWSPFGLGVCLRDEAFPEGYCSVRNCFAPWLTEGETPSSLCGDAALCAPFDVSDPASALCVQRCESADECTAGLGCLPLSAEAKACWLGCGADEDCRSGERCDMAGTPDAACVPE